MVRGSVAGAGRGSLDVDLARVEFRLDLAGGPDHVRHLAVGDLAGQHLEAAVGADRQAIRRDDLESLPDVGFDLLDGLHLADVGVDDAHGEVPGERRVREDVQLFVAAVAEFDVELLDGELEDLGVDPRVVAVADVQPQADVVGDVGDDPLQALADDGVIVGRRREGRLVDLDVACAGVDEGGDLLVDEVREVVCQRLVGLVGLVERPARERVRGP